MEISLEEKIKVMEHFQNNGKIEYSQISKYEKLDWEGIALPSWDWANYNYRIKEYKYPLYFKSRICKDFIVKFTSLTSGIVISQGENKEFRLDEEFNSYKPHTDTSVWEQVEEPKQIKKVVIEKWLTYNRTYDVYTIIESSKVDTIIESSKVDIVISPSTKKVKLLETYEVEVDV